MSFYFKIELKKKLCYLSMCSFSNKKKMNFVMELNMPNFDPPYCINSFH